jgi:hypothetical protein
MVACLATTLLELIGYRHQNRLPRHLRWQMLHALVRQ